MNSSPSQRFVATEHHRLAACLVHSVPGVTAVVTTDRGERLLVAHHRADATLDPCGLRAAFAATGRAGVPHLADVVRSIEIVAGAVDIGGGLYERGHPSSPVERWFATTLAADRVIELAAACPVQVPTDAVGVRVGADALLGASAVCVIAGPGAGRRFDDVARWLHAACLVDELTGDAGPMATR